MAANRVFGYGGLGNTFGVRTFSGKAAAGGDALIAQARSIARFLMARVFGRVN